MRKIFTLFVGLWFVLMSSQAVSINNSLSFDGVDDYIALPAIANNLSTFTIEATINPTTIAATGNVAILNTDSWSTDNGGSVHFQTEGGKIVVSVNGLDTSNGWPNSNYTPVTNQWQHVAVTYDVPNKCVKFYLNGCLLNTITYTTMPTAKIDVARIGSWTGSRFFNGKIDEVRVWNTVRTQSEIYNNMKIAIANPSTTTGLLAYYSFNQGTANATNTDIALNDASATPKNGTLTGFALTGTTSNWVSGFDATQLTDILMVSANSATLSPTNSNATTINVNSNATWTAVSSAAWLTVTPTIATTGNATLNISATAIAVGVADRTATITVSGAGLTSQVITVTQTNPTILNVTATTASLTVANSNATTIGVTCNNTWTAVSSDAWLTITPTTPTTGSATLNISASAIAVGAANRTATITISAGGIGQIITVTQSNPRTLTVSKNSTYLTTANSNTSTVAVSSNSTWTAVSSAPWLTVTPSGATTGDASLNLSAPAIAVGDPDRIATVTISGAGLTSQVINVTQTNIKLTAPDLYFQFENNPTSTTTTNSGTLGNSVCTVTGCTITPNGQFGNALTGTGIASAGVATGWLTDLGAGSWTISMYITVPLTTPSGNPQYFFGDFAASEFRCFTGGWAGDNNLVLRGTGITDVYINTIGANPAVVTFVYDATIPDIKAYKNGGLVSTVAQTAFTLSKGSGFKVGGYDARLSNNGIMDEFKLYKKALSASEIAVSSEQQYNIVTSINNVSESQLLVYPNPTSDVINLSSAEGIETINITNLAGNTVWSGSASEFPINVSSFAKGIYLVNILSADGVKTEKVMIK